MKLLEDWYFHTEIGSDLWNERLLDYLQLPSVWNFGEKKTGPFLLIYLSDFQQTIIIVVRMQIYRILCFKIKTEKLQLILQHAMKRTGYSSNFYILSILSRIERRLFISNFVFDFQFFQEQR